MNREALIVLQATADIIPHKHSTHFSQTVLLPTDACKLGVKSWISFSYSIRLTSEI